ncbi:hypothetical protein MANES_12G130200v8 [Manihot esculenta]|nr:hypothetical protein MANES_12G130200v8 [Manihot esculenta]
MASGVLYFLNGHTHLAGVDQLVSVLLGMGINGCVAETGHSDTDLQVLVGRFIHQYFSCMQVSVQRQRLCYFC